MCSEEEEEEDESCEENQEMLEEQLVRLLTREVLDLLSKSTLLGERSDYWDAGSD